MSILLTGGSGFIGSAFLSQEKNVTKCISRKKLSLKNSKIEEYIVQRYEDILNWNEVFTGIETVVHLAGLAHNKAASEYEMVNFNVNDTVFFGQKAGESKIKRFIFISSVLVYSLPTKRSLDETSEIYPQNFFAKSKLDAELALKKLSGEYNFELVIVRLPLVYGVNAPGNFGLLTKLVKKAKMLPFGLINNKRSVISLKNVSNFISLVARHPKAGNELFVISENDGLSTKELTNKIATGLDSVLIQLPIPIFLFRFLGKLIGQDKTVESLVGDLQVNSSKAKNMLCWAPIETMEQSMSQLKTWNK